MSSEPAELIKKLLADALQPEFIELRDDSHLHAGHAEAPLQGGSHFSLTIVSSKFADLELVERHRLIYDTLGDVVGKRVHALAIRAYSAAEWRQTGHKGDINETG